MNPEPTQQTVRTAPSLFRLASTLILLLAIALLWINQSRTRDRLDALSVENIRLKQALDASERKIDELNRGDSSPAARERLAATREKPAAVAPEKEVETLFLEETSVEQIPEGLKVRLAFHAGSGIELPDSLTLVVRVPGSGQARITALGAASMSPDAYVEGAGAIVNADGNLGIIQCVPSELDTLAFELTVSEPVKATVRGSEGILDFELDIRPDGCAVRPL